jgi:hypothetical protein
MNDISYMFHKNMPFRGLMYTVMTPSTQTFQKMQSVFLFSITYDLLTQLQMPLHV